MLGGVVNYAVVIFGGRRVRQNLLLMHQKASRDLLRVVMILDR